MMKNYFDDFYEFTNSEDSSFIRHTALNGRIKIILKKNPNREIYHTVQVDRNGYIHSMLTGLPLEESNYKYYGERAYSDFIQDYKPSIKTLSFPERRADAKSGIEFMNSIKDLLIEEREEKIYREFLSGNIPDFMRHPVQLKAKFNDAEGKEHTVFYQTLPDYLCIGSNSDYCRVPMNPQTAQKIADKFNMTMPTRKLVDNIYMNCTQKLQPITYPWSEGLSETTGRFVEHSKSIDNQLKENKAILGELVGGIKKDVVITNLIADTNRVNHVTIYGWHKPENGKPIQPLSNIHMEKYVDYSHGIRLINSEILLDSSIVEIKNILRDPVLYKIISDENGQMTRTAYPQYNE